MAALTGTLVALTALSAGTSAYNQSQQGRAARRQGQYEAKIYEGNADVADRQAEDAIARGAEAANRQRRDVRLLGGTQRAGYAAQGVDIASGSARDVQLETAVLGELDALTIANNAKREAFGFKSQAYDSRQRAELARRGGSAAAAAGRVGAASTLLTGGAQIANLYYARN